MRIRTALIIAAVAASFTNVRAEDRLWSAVVLASNAATPKEPPKELRDSVPKLKQIFGYNQFELIGSASEKIEEKTDLTLMPTQSFWLQARARQTTSKEARGGYLLSLQFYCEKRQLVDTETRLAPASPLFIRGPAYGKGQIVFVLMIQ